MISISFHKTLTPELAQKIDSFGQTHNTVGLHQVLAFTEAMEPQKRIKYCIAENENKEIEGYCIIHTRFPIACIQDGPVSKNEKTVSEMISAIQKHLKARLFAFTTIQLPYSKNSLPLFLTNNTIAKHFDLPTWSTIIVDLSNVEILLKTFSKGHHSAIRKAEKSGITISTNFTQQTIKAFADLFDATYKSRNLATQWKNTELYFTKLAETITDKNGYFVGSYLDNKLVAGGIFLANGNTVQYKFGTSNHEYRNIPLMHSVIYNAMLHAAKQGFTQFDLGGINPEAAEGSQVQAINTFKKGFGGTIITSPKRIYLTNNPISLAIVLLLLKFKKLIRK
jgi:lipid II:glycine glycyltransferase (peptidoglycan interpeptide bridge formation enzyme)